VRRVGRRAFVLNGGKVLPKDIMTTENFVTHRPRLSLAFDHGSNARPNGQSRPATLSGKELRKIVAELLG